MKDIRSLYNEAKRSRRETDVAAYREAVNSILEDNPMQYVLNLEYIISSDIGLQTLKTFTERYGLAIPLCNYLIESIKECSDKAESRKLKIKEQYDEELARLEKYKKQYHECFTMYEYYSDGYDTTSYMEAYYGFTDGIQNKYWVAEIVNEFGERGVPDLLITARSINEKTVITVLNAVSKSDMVNPTFCEAVMNATHDLEMNSYQSDIDRWFGDRSLSRNIQEMRNRTYAQYREAVIMGEYDAVIEYNDSDIASIHDMIDLNECAMLNAPDDHCAMESFRQILSLYEELDGAVNENGDLIEEDIADSVIPMLPNSTNGQAYKAEFESPIYKGSNHDRGRIPGYLRNNHELTIGEEDPFEDDKESSKEKYRRPASDSDDRYRDKGRVKSLDDADDASDEYDDYSDERETLTPAEKRAINNYYYYTYTNSLNRNTNSFNKGNDYSHKDSHNTDINHSYNQGQTDKDAVSNESWNYEASGDKADGKPESDHPIRDTMMDIDRKVTSAGQKVKKGAQTVTQGVRAATKPVRRIDQWLSSVANYWKDKKETEIKEELADPRQRKNLYNAVKKAIINGSLLKAGILLNPLFLAYKLATRQDKSRLRTEMIGELKAEIEICEEKIKDAPDTPEGRNSKYKLMRLKNELNKKLLRVGGPKGWSKWV